MQTQYTLTCLLLAFLLSGLGQAQNLVKPQPLEHPGRLEKGAAETLNLASQVAGEARLKVWTGAQTSYARKVELGYTVRAGRWQATALTRQQTLAPGLGLFTTRGRDSTRSVYELQAGVSLPRGSRFVIRAETGHIPAVGAGLRYHW